MPLWAHQPAVPALHSSRCWPLRGDCTGALCSSRYGSPTSRYGACCDSCRTPGSPVPAPDVGVRMGVHVGVWCTVLWHAGATAGDTGAAAGDAEAGAGASPGMCRRPGLIGYGTSFTWPSFTCAPLVRSSKHSNPFSPDRDTLTSAWLCSNWLRMWLLVITNVCCWVCFSGQMHRPSIVS